MLKKFILNNGLRVLLFPMENTEAVTLLFLAATGSKYETKNISGISHLLEHLLFRGIKSYPEPGSISRALDEIGGFYNAFTDKEVLGIIFKAGVENLSLISKILTEMVTVPLLDKKELIKEKKVVVEEISMREDNPQILILDLWETLLYGDQPAGWLVIGSRKTVSSISQKNLSDHLKSSFTAKNSVLAIAGNIKEKDVIKMVKRDFSVLPGKKRFQKKSVKENQNKPEIMLHFKKTDQTHLCLGVRTVGISAFSEKKYVLAVIASLLGGMMSSRLFVEVRERRGLAYYIRTSCEHYTDSGYLVTHAGLNNEKVMEAIEIICREYQRLKMERVGDQELAKAKENLRGRLRLGLETSDSFASFFGLQELIDGKVLTPSQQWQKIAKITPDDILKVAKEVFRAENLNVALIGPQRQEKEIRNILKI
ncbi:insulinase family protein [Candidatus Parcubacteria bacterium]|nr:insulinase family protein [Patescibacteria group bacterium]MBU4466702.1 insulinase family protein [Patescibacteria group bacterium]MCG2688029.1 insulinase family protein [Candidatus Parcubacteria bacterium]